MLNTLEPSTGIRLRFGVFELDPAAEELRKAGIRVRMQAQPLRILLYLARHEGEIVSREELHRTFWKPDSTVDLDRSLAAAIHKIRECLDDSVTNPRFVETVSRSGYRFIAPVAEIRPELPQPAPLLPRHESADSTHLAAGTATIAIQPSAQEMPAASPARPFVAHRLWAAAAAVAAALLFWVVIAPGLTPRDAPAIQAVTHHASASRPDQMSQGFPGAVIDNARIYFPRRENGRGELAVVMLNGGDTTTISLPEELGSPVADDVSPDGLRLLLRDRLSTAAEQALWVASPAGQTARQVPGVLAHDSTWMPDGDTILYANGNALYTVRDNGSGNTAFARLPGRPFRMRWSPDGRRLRLTLRDDRTLDTTLWELNSDGSGAHQMLPGWHASEPVCCGTFLRGSGLYVFQAGDDRSGSLWALPAPRLWTRPPQQPFRLAGGPLSYTVPTATHSGRGIVFTGFDPSFQLFSWNDAGHRLLPAPAFLNDAARVESSPDHRWIAWVRRDDGSLWRSRADGADRVRVLGAPYKVFSMAWSPDATRLAVMEHQTGSPWRILLMDINSGHTEELLHDDPHNQADPQWAADGSAVIFGRLPQRLAEPTLSPAIFRVDLGTHRVAKLPGSEGLFSPRVSPDGRTLVALTADQTTLRQLDLRSGTWTASVGSHFDNPVFLAGGHALVFRDFIAPGVTLRRLDIDRHTVTAFDAGLQAEPGPIGASFAGLLDGDAPALSVPRNSADLYELEVPE